MIELGDVVSTLQKYDDDVFSGCFCDPPYGWNFMGKKWDGQVPDVTVWKEVYRVLKSGSILLAFGGTRTWHRLAVAIEDAGFEIRDTVMWVYGSGFPKSHNIGKAVDAFNATGKSNPKAMREVRMGDDYKPTGQKDWRKGRMFGTDIENDDNNHIINNEWKGYGTALKPAYEPIIMAMKPVAKNYVDNALNHGVSGINIDASRIGTETRTYKGSGSQPNKLDNHGKGSTGIGYADGRGADNEYTVNGRWPANFIHDGSVDFPESRFFYCAKASKKERNEGVERNNHPTVKPIALCEYLAKMILPPKKHKLLVPFSGSGSEVIGALKAGWKDVTGIEISDEYVEISKKRIEHHCGEKGLEKFFV